MKATSMNTLLTLGIAVIGFLAVPGMLNAQERIPEKPAKIHPDHTVTFTFRAPNAKSVVLVGTWPGGSAHTSLPMIEDDKGIWTVTSPPIPPDLWSYSFHVDDATGADGDGGRGGGGGGGGANYSLLIVGPVGSESYNL